MIRSEKREIVTRSEIRTNDARFQLTGTAVAYNTLSANDTPFAGWREQIAPGAFRKTLAGATGELGPADVRALWSHNKDLVLGRQKNSTLLLKDAPTGLQYVLQLDPTSQFHRDCFASVKRGDVDALSFGFICNSDQQNQSTRIRTVTDAELFEISFVSWPAYPVGTSAEARSKQGDASLQERIAILRRSAQIIKTEILRQRKEMQSRDFMSAEDFASLGEHMRLAHELCEAACAMSGTVRDVMDAGDCEDEFDPDGVDGYRCFRDSHQKAHAALDEACTRCAETRLDHMAAAKVLGRARK
jgi:HK97 family phage prohead protease